MAVEPALIAVASIASEPIASRAPAHLDARPNQALPEVIAAVRAARRGKRIPSGLMPPVGELRDERLPYSLPHGCVPVAASSQSASKICPTGHTKSRRTIVLIGDSHAQMWMPAVLRLAAWDNWRVVPLLRPGCTPDTWVDNRGLAACRPWYRWATREVKVLRPDVTLVGGAVGGYRGAAARAAEHGIASMARALKRVSRKVVVVGDPQGLSRNPLDCLLSRNASMARCTTTWAPERLRPYENIAADARKLGVGFLDTQPWFCFEYQCPAVIGRAIAFKDGHHITAAYALHVAGTFTAAFRQATRRS